jgi:hypothetical protein
MFVASELPTTTGAPALGCAALLLMFGFFMER